MPGRGGTAPGRASRGGAQGGRPALSWRRLSDAWTILSPLVLRPRAQPTARRRIHLIVSRQIIRILIISCPQSAGGLRAGAAGGRDYFHGSAARPPARGTRGLLRPADDQPARPLQLDTGGRPVGGGGYRAVDMSPGVHAVSAQVSTPRPGRRATRDHDQRHWASPAAGTPGRDMGPDDRR